MLMAGELSIDLREYLKRCGLSESKIAQCNGGTRLYHDLGLYGDSAEACIAVLADQYHVDLSGFEFERFFPVEFVGGNVVTRTLLWLVPFASKAVRQRGEYLPITLRMIDDAMRIKRWHFDGGSSGYSGEGR